MTSDREGLPERWLQRQIDLILKNQERFDGKLDEIFRETQRTGMEMKIKIAQLEIGFIELEKAQARNDQNLDTLKKTLLRMIIGLIMTGLALALQQWVNK